MNSQRASSRAEVAGVLPVSVMLTLFLSCAAQYVGAGVLALFLIFDLEYEPAQITAFYMYCGWSGWFSPVVGYISDTLCFRQERRRPCMVLGNAINIGLWCVIALRGATMSSSAFALVCVAQCIAQQLIFVPLNGVVVERGHAALPQQLNEVAAEGTVDNNRSSDNNDEEPAESFSGLPPVPVPVPAADPVANPTAGRAQSTAMLLRSCGSLFGASLQTCALAYLSVQASLWIAVCLYGLCYVPMAFFPPEVRGPHSYTASLGLGARCVEMGRRLSSSCKAGRAAGELGALCLVLTFIFFYNAVPDGSVVYYQFTALEFKFPTWLISMNSSLGMIGAIASCFFYNRFLAKRNQTVVLAAGCVFAAVGYGTNILLATGASRTALHIPNMAFVPTDNFFTTFFSRLAFLPVLHVASHRCPRGFEAFVFELFTAVALGASSVAALITTHMSIALGLRRHDFSHLWMLLACCAACKLAPLLLLPLLPKPPAESTALDASVTQGLLRGREESDTDELPRCDVAGSGSGAAAARCGAIQ